MDILYSDEIKKKIDLFDNRELSISQIELMIFEWGGGTLIGEYFLSEKCGEINIEVSEIIKLIDDQSHLQSEVFSTDSGVICILDYNCMQEFLIRFNYDDFVDAVNSGNIIFEEYIKSIIKYTGYYFAIISTPGINKGFDFDGSGSFFIKNNCFQK